MTGLGVANKFVPSFLFGYHYCQAKFQQENLNIMLLQFTKSFRTPSLASRFIYLLVRTWQANAKVDVQCQRLELSLVSLDDSRDLMWKLGHLAVPGGGSQQSTLQHAPQRPIVHQFRQPDKRPPELVAYAFTVAVLLPIVLLLGSWRHLGVNLQAGYYQTLSCNMPSQVWGDCILTNFNALHFRLDTIYIAPPCLPRTGVSVNLHAFSKVVQRACMANALSILSKSRSFVPAKSTSFSLWRILSNLT